MVKKMIDESSLNVLSNKNLGIPRDHLYRLKQLSASTFEYISKDVINPLINFDNIKYFLKMIINNDFKTSYLLLKYNSNTYEAYFESNKIDLTLTEKEFEAVKQYIGEHIENGPEFYEQSVLNGHIIPFKFSHSFTDGFNILRITTNYLSKSSRDYLKIKPAADGVVLEFEMAIFFKDGLYYIFEDYSGIEFFNNLISQLNYQMKIVKFVAPDQYKVLQRSLNFKLRVNVIMTTEYELSEIKYKLITFKADLFGVGELIELFDNYEFIYANDIITSPFFERAFTFLSKKYNISFKYDTKEDLDQSLTLLEMIEI